MEQNTFLFDMLRNPDFWCKLQKITGAHNHYDLWLFIWRVPWRFSMNSIIGAMEAGTAFANTLLKVLDGQQCRLDSSKVTKVNVPIVMIANYIPQRKGPISLPSHIIRIPIFTLFRKEFGLDFRPTKCLSILRTFTFEVDKGSEVTKKGSEGSSFSEELSAAPNFEEGASERVIFR